MIPTQEQECATGTVTLEFSGRVTLKSGLPDGAAGGPTQGLGCEAAPAQAAEAQLPARVGR